LISQKYFENLAEVLLGQSYRELSSGEKRVIQSIAENSSVSEDINETFHETLTLGQRLVDKIAAFGGSWSFILTFFAFIAGWILLNIYSLTA